MRDLNLLTDKEFEILHKHWIIQKSSHRFFNLPIDQIHEQENCKVKGNGGIIALTENPESLQKWMICDPEVSRIVTAFEHVICAKYLTTFHTMMRVTHFKRISMIKFAA